MPLTGPSGTVAVEVCNIPQPDTAGAFDLDGQRVRTYHWGDGQRTVLFVHGFASALVVWHRLLKDFGATHRVVALDLPGFGFSDKRKGDYSPQGLADLLADFLAQRGIAKAHVVAHSWGSSVALAA